MDVGRAANRDVLADHLGPVDTAAPFWSRDGRTEIDLIARAGDHHVFFATKWHRRRPTDLDALHQLRVHVTRYPRPAHRKNARYAIVSATGFTDRVHAVADAEGIILVDAKDLLP